MSEPGFLDAAVVLIGHGSTKNDQSSEAVREQAAALRQKNIFADVREAFWKEEPKLPDVARSLNARRVFFVPMFVSEGYFSEGAVPKALGFHDCRRRRRYLPSECVGGAPSPVRPSEPGSLSPSDGERVQGEGFVHGQTEWFYCKPVGTHDRMTEVLLKRARQVVKQFPFPRPPIESEITLFVAGHGTEQHENSRKSIEHQAELLRAMKLYGAVEPAFLEEEPRISSCYELAKTKNIVIVPFFIGGGMHVQEDIPMLLGEPERIVKKRLHEGKSPWRNPTERKGKLVWYAESVGRDPALVEVILERVKEAAASEGGKVIT